MHAVLPSASPGSRIWPRWPLLTALAVLFAGPIAAPLFQATGLPFLAPTGALARDVLAHYVCPTPAKSYLLLGFPMGVCARCWGATIGLWVGYWLYRGQWSDEPGTINYRRAPLSHSSKRFILQCSSLISRYTALHWPLRLLISALPFLLWPAEIAWWPAAPYWALLLNGALAGVFAGLFFCSVWPGAYLTARAPGCEPGPSR